MNKQIEKACKVGDLVEVKRLKASGVDIHAGDDLAFRWASLKGHLNIVKYLVENGADIHSCDDCALRWSSEKGHLDVVNYFKQQLRKEKLVVLLAD